MGKTTEKRFTMKIQRLTIANYNQIVALWKHAGLPFKPSGRDRKSAVQTQMAANPDFFLGAFEDNRLVGMVVATSDGRKGWINRLAVDPNFRRKGIAEKLISEAENALKKHGLRMFCALIDDDNKISKQLFKKCGYEEHRDIVYFRKKPSDRI
jgi:ribosomal protein S18 acetylase RimI-like enzyme